MARYGKETTLPPRTVLRLAHGFFGPESQLGLQITTNALSELGFAGSGGTVQVTAQPQLGQLQLTDVTILSREFDYWAEAFLVVLSDAERGPNPLQRAAGWLAARLRR